MPRLSRLRWLWLRRLVVGRLWHLVGRITQDEYDKKARELKERQTEIELRIDQHQNGEGNLTLESLIYLASRAADLKEG
jgi:hypothetical protein